MKETFSSASGLLFPLQYRGKALALLLLQPQRQLHVREIARLTGTAPGTMSKELTRLSRAGLLAQRRVGNQVQFSANAQHPVFPELSALLRKTIGLTDVLSLALTPVAQRIACAFVFGSVASGSETAQSDVDIIIIGSLAFGEAVALLHEAQTTLQREINPKIYAVEEWRAKVQAQAAFVMDVLSKPKLFVIGAQHDLDALAEPGQDRSA